MDKEERADLVSRLFAVMTSKVEDAAGEAAEGQGKDPEERDQIGRAKRIELLARDVGIIAEAAMPILRSSS